MDPALRYFYELGVTIIDHTIIFSTSIAQRHQFPMVDREAITLGNKIDSNRKYPGETNKRTCSCNYTYRLRRSFRILFFSF